MLKAKKTFKESRITKITSSRPEVLYKRGVLKNFIKFIGKHWCSNLFLIKLQALRLFLIELQAILFTKKLQHRCFPVNFAKSLRTTIL